MNVLFKGNPKAPIRSSLAAAVSGKDFAHVAIPFVRRFVHAEVIVKAIPVPPATVYASDVGLFPSVLGYFLAGRDLSHLGIHFNAEPLEPLQSALASDPLTAASTTLYAINWCQLRGPTFYADELRRDFELHRDHHIGILRGQLEAMKSTLDGCSYVLEDPRKTVARFRDDPAALILLDPPALVKTFNFKGAITWAEPQVPEFDGVGDDYRDMLRDLVDASATTIAAFVHGRNVSNLDLMPTDWHRFAGMMGSNWKHDAYLASSRDLADPRLSRRMPSGEIPRYPVWDDSTEITRKSHVDIAWVRPEVAGYYRDLFVHRLGSTGSEIHGLVLLNKHVIAAFGVTINQATRRGYHYVHETYAISAHSDRYPYLSRLPVMLMSTESFLKTLKKRVSFGVHTPTHMRTICLARLPDVRLNAFGIRKVLSREKLPNGMWAIGYESEFQPHRTYKTMLAMFIDHHEKRLREKHGTEAGRHEGKAGGAASSG